MNFTDILVAHGIAGGGGVKEFFGGGVDGALNTSGNVTLAVTTEDVSSVVKRYSSITINAGHTLTVDKRCQGLFLFCEGNVVINGTIGMSSKSALVDNGAGYVITKIAKLMQGELTDANAKAIVFGPGGAGGAGAPQPGYYFSPYIVHGGLGSRGFWFGGGRGGGGAGGLGGSFSGSIGVGGNGGDTGYDANVNTGGAGSTTYATPGGNGSNGSGGGGGAVSTSSRYGGNGGSSAAGSGAGGGGGAGDSASGSVGQDGIGWGGGLVCIIARGNVTIGATGQILANGANGGNGGNGGATGGNYDGFGGHGGGGNGGGCVYVLHKGTLTNSGAIQVNGGAGGTGGLGNDYSARNGQNGNAGSVGKIITQLI